MNNNFSVCEFHNYIYYVISSLFPSLSLRDNNIEECGLEMYFAQDYEVLGVVKNHELIDGGSEKLVTEENKLMYIE